ncbi:MAG: NFACT family protein [Oscillospiraceae bacterium]|nr:NFACT family protein [Oscillospiraceae bacterium]
MSLDGGFLHIVKTEIQDKLPPGARVDKIHQPSRDEVIVSFRVGGEYRRILFSANPMSARVCLTSLSASGLTPYEAESSAAVHRPPPMFCMMLRKHIGSGRLNAVTQDRLERILGFDFICTNEIGDTVNNRLIIEIMGRTSNIILINADSGGIIDSIKRVGIDVSQTRQVLPNLEYVAPPRDSSRYCLLDCDIDGTEWSLQDKTLLKQLEGVSPIFVREALFYAEENQRRLREFLHKAKETLLQNNPQITLVSDSDGKPRDFCFMPIHQYGDVMRTLRVESANELLDRFFAEKSAVERLKQRSGDMMKGLNNSYERLLRKLENQRLELVECKEREKLKLFGDLIYANIYRLKKGDRVLECENYVTGGEEEIKLDSRLSPQQNAQKYYSAYRKLDTAEKKLRELISEGECELLYLDSVIDAASRAVSDAEISALREEIGQRRTSGGTKNRKQPKQSKQSKPLPPLKFTAGGDGEGFTGFEVLVGRNNKQNDELTFKVAKPNDIWLHTKDIAGSHVILRCDGENPPPEVIMQAAIIAAQHSKARESSRVPVDYTFAKFVKKPGGSKPGYVIFTNNKTLYVNPS